jgi:hypothetical protein
MSVIMKEFEPGDTMAEMEMELALAKLKLGPKKDPNELMDEFASIECQYSLELTESKKQAQIWRLGGTQYASIIATTSMIHREKKATLTTERLLEEMHMQWCLAGGKSKDDKDSDDENEIALAATNTKKRGKKSDGKEKKENPNKDKTCNHCKKKGHLEATCWEKHPEKMPENVKAARSKAKSEGSKKTSVAMAAIEDEGEIILVAADHDIKDAYTCVPIQEETDYIFLNDGIESNKEEESEENNAFNIHDLLSVEEVAAEVWKKVAPKCQSKLQTMEMYKSSVDVDLQHSDEDEI